MGVLIAESNEACASTDASVTQSVDLDPYRMNLMSLNIVPFDTSVESVFGGLDLLLVKNDDSDNYVPAYSVDQINDVDSDEGYRVFLNGGDTQVLTVDGLPVDAGLLLSLDAYRMNLLPYLPGACLATSDVFGDVAESILLVKDDNSDYYVPQNNVETLSEMCPGEAYAVFLNGADGIDFTYPTGALSSNHANVMLEDYKLRTKTDNVTVTGESHLFIVESLEGAKVGDQLRAYDNGDNLVGAINIVDEHINGHVIDLVVHKSVDLTEFGGPVVEGCHNSSITLKLYNSSDNKEYIVETDLNGSCSNDNVSEFSVLGMGSVSGEDIQVTSFKLTQNYPNPFNPTTRINYNVNIDGHVSLKIYDIMGRLVKILVNDYRVAGNENGYDVHWDGTDKSGSKVSAGLYIYSLQTADMNMTKKMVLMK